MLNTLATLAASIHKLDRPVPDLIPLEQVDAMFRRSLDLDPTLPRNFARAGAFHLETDNLDEAERCLSRSFRLDRTSARWPPSSPNCTNKATAPRDALAVLDLALREGCDEPHVTWQAAMLAFSLDQFEPLEPTSSSLNGSARRTLDAALSGDRPAGTRRLRRGSESRSTKKPVGIPINRWRIRCCRFAFRSNGRRSRRRTSAADRSGPASGGCHLPDAPRIHRSDGRLVEMDALLGE